MVALGQGGFITLEGGEGTGKSTQAARLVERLKDCGVEALATREPGGSPRAETIRAALLSGAVAPLGPTAEALMFSAARIDHIEARISPALRGGAFVVCDRFIDSTRVYQGRVGRVDPALLAAMERVATGGLQPDLTLILDLAPEVGLLRARARRGTRAAADRFEREAMEFHERVRSAFRAIADREPGRCQLIDAERSPEKVADEVWDRVVSRFTQLESRSAKAARAQA